VYPRTNWIVQVHRSRRSGPGIIEGEWTTNHKQSSKFASSRYIVVHSATCVDPSVLLPRPINPHEGSWSGSLRVSHEHRDTRMTTSFCNRRKWAAELQERVYRARSPLARAVPHHSPLHLHCAATEQRKAILRRNGLGSPAPEH
jgi:hypothetical protein